MNTLQNHVILLYYLYYTTNYYTTTLGIGLFKVIKRGILTCIFV
eukprot:UN10719